MWTGGRGRGKRSPAHIETVMPRHGHASRMGRPSTIICTLCDQPILFAQIARHMRTAHPDMVAAGEKLDRDMTRAWGRIAIPAILVWAAGFFLLIALIATEGLPRALYPVFAAMFFVPFAIIIVPYFLARRATRAEKAAIWARPQYCRICDRTMPARALKDHVREAHPAVARLYRVGRIYLLASAMGLVILLALVYWLALPSWPREMGPVPLMQGLSIVGFFTWLGLGVAWGRLVTVPRLARARGDWQAHHPKFLQPAEPHGGMNGRA